MHAYQLRAEYQGEEHVPEQVRFWHVVADGSAEALCGRAIDEDAAHLPVADWGDTPDPMCHTCGALWLRQVP